MLAFLSCTKQSMGICKFCLQDKSLVESHIIPKRFYKEIEEPGAMRIISENQNFFPQKSRTGIYDPDILCRECEDNFQVWDDYAIKLMINSLDEFKDHHNGSLFTIDNFDYKKLKLFSLSVLWRSSISKSFFYKSVKLGKYEDETLKMLKENNPDEKNNFPVFLGRWITDHGNKNLENIFMSPTSTKFDNARLYRFYLGRFLLHIKVSNLPLPNEFKPFVIAPNKPLSIIGINQSESNDFKALIASSRKAFDVHRDKMKWVKSNE